jgi:NADPH-dependent 2,4-dienoyl-CoA reductase/sulfur reductase-like enzyme/nitrite reductase/ring-hydroxylating ferredoxin subunit
VPQVPDDAQRRIPAEGRLEEPTWEEAIREEKLQIDVPVAVKIGKKTVLLLRTKDGIHAIGGKCPHYGAPLAEGVVLDHVLTCPWHNARFEVASGEVKSPPAPDDLTLYSVKVENGVVYVKKTEPESTQEKRKQSAGGGKGRKEEVFVIIGAGAAGSTAATTLRREGFGGRIILLTEEEELPYDRPNLSKDYLAGELKREWMPLRPAAFYGEMEIEILRNYKVVGVELDQKKVTLAHETQMRYDRVLVATGGIPRTPSIPGTDYEAFFLLRSFADADNILSYLGRAQRAVIIGSGFIGLETAASLTRRGLRVDLVSPEHVPMARVFGTHIGNRIRAEHEKNGVRFHLGVAVEEIVKKGPSARVLLSDQKSIETDLIIAGIGVVPAVGFLQSSGLVESGAIPVNGFLQSKNEDLFAAGDVAIVPDSITGELRRIEHWVEALRQGQHAARSMMGRKSDYSEVPFFWTHQFDMEIRYTGYAKNPDRIVRRGEKDSDSFTIGFYESGRLKAAAGIGRDREMILLGEILKAGINVQPNRFADSGTDFREVLLKSRAGD